MAATEELIGRNVMFRDRPPYDQRWRVGAWAGGRLVRWYGTVEAIGQGDSVYVGGVSVPGGPCLDGYRSRRELTVLPATVDPRKCEAAVEVAEQRFTKRQFWLMRTIVEQQRFMAGCGGNLAGYVERYGTAEEPKFGNGGPAIFKADMDRLIELEEMLEDACGNRVRRRS